MSIDIQSIVHTIESARAAKEFIEQDESLPFNFYVYRNGSSENVTISLDYVPTGDVFVVQEGGLILQASILGKQVLFKMQPDKFVIVYYRFQLQ